ncbi:MAG TPA: glucose-6-phosphate dehydrogenase, partial [Thermodesulfobacteriota bacterium]|nr:glucose-6-phosphate dehydrogenase [Thermodesulfobacteriota bacterium]
HGRGGPAGSDAGLPADAAYVQADPGSGEGYRPLAERLARLERERATGGNRLFYLAVPPSAVSAVVRALGEAGLARREAGWTRVVVEKPFGLDLASARRLAADLHAVFEERQIFRIDHYLGKEAVQNLQVVRFANSVFEPIWTRAQVDHVQITAAETAGVEGRAAYYEEAGALRDMFQNHLLQLLALTAMEPPVSLEPEAVRDEKVRLLRAVRPPAGEEVARRAVRAQYVAGTVGGRPVRGYREEPGVRPDSTTETFAAVRLEIDTWRWAGVPFYLRSGKRLPRRVTEIAVAFRAPPKILFPGAAGADGGNLLAIRIQPEEGLALRFAVKAPGFAVHLRWVDMDFRYAASFGVEAPDPYERLLLDCLLGDATLFTRQDEVEAAWTIVTPVLEAWRTAPPDRRLPTYPAGTWGPPEADRLLAAEGRAWRQP